MNRINAIVINILSLAILISCANDDKKMVAVDQKKKPATESSITRQESDNSSDEDTSFNVFNDKNYIVDFKVIKSTEDEEEHYGTLTLTNTTDGKPKVLLKDTIEFYMPLLQFRDFNNDGTKDILILYSSGARSNWRHHLYLVDSLNHKLKRVIKFEEIDNPEIDSVNNIITSLAMSGTNYYSFYKIAKNGKLINLGHSFEDDGTDDSSKFKESIEAILSEEK